MTPQMVLDAAAAIGLRTPKASMFPQLRAAVMHSQMDDVEWLDEALSPGDGG